MVDLTPHQDYLYTQERQTIQRCLSRVRVMLWANDYLTARTEMEEIIKNHRSLILAALELKKRLTSNYRGYLKKLEDEYKKDNMKGRDLKHKAREEASKRLRLISREEDALYLLAPIASSVERLDKRIAERMESNLLLRPSTQQRNQSSHHPPSSIYDLLTGFRLTRSPYGFRQWEIRAYRFDPPPISPSHLFTQLDQTLRLSLSNLTDEEDTCNEWPLWLRGFSSESFFEFKFYDSGRFSLMLTLRYDETLDRLQKQCLYAILMSQETS